MLPAAVVWPAALGFAGDLFGASQAKKAAAKQAEAIRLAASKRSSKLQELAKPWLEQADFAMPKMQSLIESILAPRADKESPLLAGAHTLNVGRIKEDTQGAISDTSRFWSALGNTGRARGEELRIKRAGTRALNEESLGYGEKQQAHKDAGTSRLWQALLGTAEMGARGMAPAMSAADAEYEGAVGAANIRKQGTSDFWSDLGTGIGDFQGTIQGTKDRKDWLSMLGPKSGKTEGTGGGSWQAMLMDLLNVQSRKRSKGAFGG